MIDITAASEAVSIKAEIKLLKNKNKIVVELSPHFILNLT